MKKHLQYSLAVSVFSACVFLSIAPLAHPGPPGESDSTSWWRTYVQTA